MSSTTSAEKLVALQNGVFRRKEISAGFLYHDGTSFSSNGPSGNGNWVLNVNNGTMTWADASNLAPEEFDTLNNTYFKTSSGEALAVPTTGNVIPYFTESSTFAGIYVSTSGPKFISVANTTFTPSLEDLNASAIFGNILGLTGTSSKPIVPLWNGTTTTGLIAPTATGWCALRVVTGSSTPGFEILTGNAFMKNVLGLTEGIVIPYANAGSAKELTVSGTGPFMLSNSNGTLSTVPYEREVLAASTVSLIGDNLPTLANPMDLGLDGITLAANTKYLVSLDIVLKTSNYEAVLENPSLNYGLRFILGSTDVIDTYIGNAQTFTYLSGTAFVTTGTTAPTSVSIASENYDGNIPYTIVKAKMTVLKL